MATNDFLPLAAAAGSNVASQTDYAAASSTATGFIAGVAQSAMVNKALRQSSSVAAMIGQFIVDQAAVNATDNGVISTLEANFVAAILAAVKNSAGFGAVKATSGYFKHPSGIIVQWGGSVVSGSGTSSPVSTPVSFPVAFPTQAYRVVAVDAGASCYSQGVSTLTTSGFLLYARDNSAGGIYPSSTISSYVAIGG